LLSVVGSFADAISTSGEHIKIYIYDEGGNVLIEQMPEKIAFIRRSTVQRTCSKPLP